MLYVHENTCAEGLTEFKYVPLCKLPQTKCFWKIKLPFSNNHCVLGYSNIASGFVGEMVCAYFASMVFKRAKHCREVARVACNDVADFPVVSCWVLNPPTTA